MRVIAGTYRSRLLKTLKGQVLRPTSDRLRETLFNVLGASVQGARFIDVFAGTGAVGIEALSRGAAEVVFIENHRPAATLIRHNLESLGLSCSASVLALDAISGLEKVAREHTSSDSAFQFVFLDPPYAEEQNYLRVLRFLASAQFLASGAVVIAEHSRKHELPERIGNLTRVRLLRQGDAALTFYRIAGTD
jgi:16S rRNA (guanine(966)-N(2))-methyltransferase RsmD